MNYVNFKRLNDNQASPAPITNEQIANTVTLISEALRVERNVGFIVLLVTENKAGAGGNVAIYATYSDDGVNFYRTYTTDLAGNLTQEGNIVTGLSNTTRRIMFTARLAKFVQFNFVASANSQVTADVSFQESDQ